MENLNTSETNCSPKLQKYIEFIYSNNIIFKNVQTAYKNCKTDIFHENTLLEIISIDRRLI